MTEIRYYASERVFGVVRYLVKVGGLEMDVSKEDSLLKLREKLGSLTQQKVTLINGPEKNILYWQRKLTPAEEREFLSKIREI